MREDRRSSLRFVKILYDGDDSLFKLIRTLIALGQFRHNPRFAHEKNRRNR